MEHVFADDSFTTVNADVHYDFEAGSRAFFWVGAGIAGIINGDLDAGVNAFAGYGVRRGELTPYLQAKIIFSDGDTTPVIGGGVRF